MKATFATLTVFLMATPALARDFYVSVLPFQVTGNVPQSHFNPASLPVQLQQATSFLLQLNRDYPVDDPLKINRSLPAATLQTGASPGVDWCGYSNGTHVLLGEASFSGTQNVRISLTLKSCNTGSNAGQSARSGSLNDLQSLLRDAINGACSRFAPNRPPSWPESSGEWIAVVDLSGSMASEKEALALGLERSGFEGKLGLILVSENGARLVVPDQNRASIISILKAAPSGGEVRLNDMAAALQELRKLPQVSRRIIIATDAEASSTASFESSIRLLKSQGQEPVLLETSGLSQSGRAFFQRLNRSLKLKDPDVTYGMRAGFAEGFSLFFVQSGDRFYTAKKDLTSAIRSGRLNKNDLDPVATVNLRDDRLTLRSVIDSYARKNGLRLIGTGQLVSGLESSLSALQQSASGSQFKVLLRNDGSAFWIDVESRAMVQKLMQYKSRKIYVGLQLQPGPLGPQNHPAAIYIRSADQAPTLFLQKYDHVRASEKLLKKADVWFFLVEVVDSR
ncbi:MAG: VWA domain-containing protein [Leptospiraceae bacterium]|nr:VWA domain-containing protein [Leptospiraceae bacterium]